VRGVTALSCQFLINLLDKNVERKKFIDFKFVHVFLIAYITYTYSNVMDEKLHQMLPY
jgi:hypothetical protein